MKRLFAYLSVLYMTTVCDTGIHAQDNPVMSYFQQAGVHAEIYNGKMETLYNLSQYKNLPYFMNDEYTETLITYRKSSYPVQQARLDLFREQLILLLPEKRYGIIVDPQHIDEFTMNHRTFIWYTPPKDSKLKSGYYVRLFEGQNLQLLNKETVTTNSTTESLTVISYFIRKTRFYLTCNGQCYQVKNANSFSKIFPQHKKQINAFVRSSMLDFKRAQAFGLEALAMYCDDINDTL